MQTQPELKLGTCENAVHVSGTDKTVAPAAILNCETPVPIPDPIQLGCPHRSVNNRADTA